MNNEYACMLRNCHNKTNLYLIKELRDTNSNHCIGFQILKKTSENEKDIGIASVLISDNRDIFITQKISNGGFAIRHFIEFCEEFYEKFKAPKLKNQYFFKTKSYYDIGFFEYSSPDCPESQREIFSRKSNKKIIENNGMIICFRAWEQYYKICTITIDVNGNLNIEISEELRLAEVH